MEQLSKVAKQNPFQKLCNSRKYPWPSQDNHWKFKSINQSINQSINHLKGILRQTFLKETKNPTWNF